MLLTGTAGLIFAAISAALELEPVKGLLKDLPSLFSDRKQRLNFGAVLARQLEKKVARKRALLNQKTAKLGDLLEAASQPEREDIEPRLLLLQLGQILEQAGEFLVEVEEEADKIGDICEGKDDDVPPSH